MSAAILYAVIFQNTAVPLSWARRFWGSGLVWVTGSSMEVVPGFVPDANQPYIFAMNHQSMFDIVVAFVGIPINIRFIAKKILRDIPFLGWYMRATDMVFIDRRNHVDAVRSLDEACQKIKNGASILVYPEGTRAKEGEGILPFKKGPFVMAIQAGVPIVPVAIDGSSKLLPRNSMRIESCKVRMILGEPIPTKGLTEADREELTRKVRNAIIDLHGQIGGLGGDKESALAPSGVEGYAEVPRPEPRQRPQKRGPEPVSQVVPDQPAY